MLRKKTVQVNTQKQTSEMPDSVAADIAETRKQLKRKGLMTLASLLLLVVVAVVGTVAWYTRVSNVTGMTMDVAKFDFNANYTTSEFLIDVGGYMTSTLAEGKAAPGTKGVIPIRMSSGKSETAVTYSLNLDFAEMADEFQNRLRFYYYTSDDALHVIDPATATQTSSAITGKLAASGQNGATKYEYIYWEWVYELDDDWFAQDRKWYHKADGASERYNYGNKTNQTGQQVFDALYPDEIPTGATENTRTAAIDAFDKFDTNIGLGKCDAQIECHYAGDPGTVEAKTDEETGAVTLKAYQVAMKLKLHVTGAQAQPVPIDPNDGTLPITPGTAGTAVYKSNG